MSHKLILLIPLITLFFFSCSEDEPELKEEFYFRFKIDGALFEYPLTADSSNLWGQFNYKQNDRFYTTAIVGSKSYETHQDESLTIVILDSAQLKLNTTYTNYGTNSDYNPYTFSILFKFEGHNYYTLSERSIDPSGVKGDGEFVVTHIDDRVIRGTFSSTLFKDNNLDETIELSDGEFSVSTTMRAIR